MTRRILITGASGFTGRYMRKYLRSLGQKLNIIGMDIIKPEDDLFDEFITADIACAKAVEDVVERTRPDYIIHLAGTFGSNNNEEMYRVNTFSMVNLLEAVIRYIPESVIVATGSAAEYGRITEEQLPVKEDCPCNPVMLYGFSKLLATQIALYYHRISNINITIVRPFQLIGKGVSSRLAPGAFANQLKQAISSNKKVIEVGNLESSRDFLDVHDAAEAIWALCENPAGGEIFNLCSQNPVKISDMLAAMIKASDTDVEIKVDPKRLRGKSDVSVVYGSFEKLNKHCGWKPKISLQDSVRDMFDGD
ncbi:MAG: NAD-dependent epimerase/dehydratase family protein [Sedimentisphaerales bacterium]|nr:NAD-dependent epimerase/dehydratase family protein [Sedimentisphaerales bacterium]